ncbi:MAG: DUF134 domain-containing protein [Candidatus Bipolaricaulia bacterium]
MGRPKKPRYCREFDGVNLLKPAAVPLTELELVVLEMDELEAMRLCDLEGHDQSSAAEVMGVSRGTIQRMLCTGREKLLDTIVHGKALIVSEAAHVVTRPGTTRSGKRRGQGQGHISESAS